MEEERKNGSAETNHLTNGEAREREHVCHQIAAFLDRDSGSEETNNRQGWKVLLFIIGNETFEKLAAIGTLANLLFYLTTVFNLKNITAAHIINIFNGTTNFSTLVGAYLCDKYFGRFKTLGFCKVAYFLGLQVIQLTAAIRNLHPPDCGDNTTCVGPTAGQMAFLITGFGLLVIGAAGIHPCNLAFGNDQFNPMTESGEREINSFFDWYYFTITFAQIASLTLIVYVQSNVSWAVGLMIPAILMLISCAVFFKGSKIYVKVKAQGSPLTSVAQVIVAAIKKKTTFAANTTRELSSQLYSSGCLDKAAIETGDHEKKPDGSSADPWRLCSMQQVEEVKCIIRVMPIWFAGMFCFLPIVQQQTYAIFQATQMDRRLGNTNFRIPAASYVILLTLSHAIFTSIYKRLIVPFLQSFTREEGNIIPHQKVGIGLFFGVLTMLVSAIVEERRRSIALMEPTLRDYPRQGAISSMSALWLIPQFTFAGLTEVFLPVGLFEFYGTHLPENMRSIANSLHYCGMAGSSYLSSILILIIHKSTKGAERGSWLSEDLNKGRLDYFYNLIAALEFLNLVYFLVWAWRNKHTKKGVASPEDRKMCYVQVKISSEC